MQSTLKTAHRNRSRSRSKSPIAPIVYIPPISRKPMKKTKTKTKPRPVPPPQPLRKYKYRTYKAQRFSNQEPEDEFPIDLYAGPKRVHQASDVANIYENEIRDLKSKRDGLSSTLARLHPTTDREKREEIQKQIRRIDVDLRKHVQSPAYHVFSNRDMAGEINSFMTLAKRKK